MSPQLAIASAASVLAMAALALLPPQNTGRFSAMPGSGLSISAAASPNLGLSLLYR